MNCLSQIVGQSPRPTRRWQKLCLLQAKGSNLRECPASKLDEFGKSGRCFFLALLHHRPLGDAYLSFSHVLCFWGGNPRKWPNGRQPASRLWSNQLWLLAWTFSCTSVLWLWWMEQVLASSVRSKREISCAKQQKVSNTWGKNIKNACKCLLFQVWISFSSIINNTAWNAVESQAAPPLPGLQRRWACHGWLQHVTANTLYHRKNLKTVSIVSSRNVLAFTANDRFHSNHVGTIVSIESIVYSSLPHSQTVARLRTATSCISPNFHQIPSYRNTWHGQIFSTRTPPSWSRTKIERGKTVRT